MTKLRDIIIFGLMGYVSACSAFDYAAYARRYPELRIKLFTSALKNYMRVGYPAGKTSCAPVINTNFDWNYYSAQQGLACNSEQEAVEHYRTVGSAMHAPYCASYTIVILLHLYNLNMIDEMISKIQFFMHNNPTNRYRIKISIPIGKNFKECKRVFDAQLTTTNYKTIDKLSSVSGAASFDQIAGYIHHQLHMPRECIDIIFCQNRGLDIGGFFVTLDELIQEDEPFDFIIKLHTKSNPDWRKLSMSFMNIKINTLLSQYDVIYSNRLLFDYRNRYARPSAPNVRTLLSAFNVPHKNFSYPAGTMFIASKKFVEFYKTLNLKPFIDRFLKADDRVPKDGSIEHAFERFFGYIFDHLGMKTRVIDYYAPSRVDALLGVVSRQLSLDTCDIN